MKCQELKATIEKITSKWIVDLNVKPQKETGENHLGLGLGGEFLETFQWPKMKGNLQVICNKANKILIAKLDKAPKPLQINLTFE